MTPQNIHEAGFTGVSAMPKLPWENRSQSEEPSGAPGSDSLVSIVRNNKRPRFKKGGSQVLVPVIVI